MKYGSYLAFDKEKAQTTFKEIFHTLLDNDKDIHSYSDNVHKEKETNLESMEPLAGGGIGGTIGSVTGFVVGEIATFGALGPVVTIPGAIVGGAIGAGIGKVVKIIKHDTKWGHYKRDKEDFCGWCWECTYQVLIKKGIFQVKEWICPEDCQLILLLKPLDLVEDFHHEDKRAQKQKTYQLKKNIVYSFDFSDRCSIKVEKIGRIGNDSSNHGSSWEELNLVLCLYRLCFPKEFSEFENEGKDISSLDDFVNYLADKNSKLEKKNEELTHQLQQKKDSCIIY